MAFFHGFSAGFFRIIHSVLMLQIKAGELQHRSSINILCFIYENEFGAEKL